MTVDTSTPARGLSASSNSRAAAWFGPAVALATSGMTLLTFALALTALPDRAPYPFTDPVILAQWPGDYYWMFPAMALTVLFVAFVAVLHPRAPDNRKVFGMIALTLAGVAAAVLWRSSAMCS